MINFLNRCRICDFNQHYTFTMSASSPVNSKKRPLSPQLSPANGTGKRPKAVPTPINPHTVAPQETHHQVHFPLNTVGFLGAPLVDGQNLEGADLAPLAMREAGVMKLVKKLGYGWEDWGDLDFYKRYAELGILSISVWCHSVFSKSLESSLLSKKICV